MFWCRGDEETVHMLGEIQTKKEMYCNIYHDEREIPNKWLYHGFLFIPCENETTLLDILDNARSITDWSSPIHFHALRNTYMENRLAELWILSFCNDLPQLCFFYLFGVDKMKLTKTLWIGQTEDKIYNRFFQIGLYSAIKWFFLNETAGYKQVTVNQIISHAKDRPEENRFKTQPIEDIQFKSEIKRENIVFKHPIISEISDDHRIESGHSKRSHIIQFVDLIIGGFSQIFDYTSKHYGKCIIADKLCTSNLPQEIIYPKSPKFASYYYKKYAISFFPKAKASEKDILERNIAAIGDQFYNYRDLGYTTKYQPDLFNNVQS